MKARNSGATSASICAENLLTHCHPISVLDYWLAAFVLEARRQVGNYYPGNMVRSILAALFCFLKENVGVRNDPNLIDQGQREAKFPHLYNALDCHLKTMDIGVQIHLAFVIIPDMKNRLWMLGIFGTHSDKVLLNAGFFYNFLLRGVQEHVDLCMVSLLEARTPSTIPMWSLG